MVIRLISATALGALALSLLSLPAAYAADPGFCHTYAQAAVNQVRLGLGSPRCEYEMHGTRWSSEFRVHYDWCLGASYEAVRNERAIRTGFLESCRHR